MLDVAAPMFAFARVTKITTIAYLQKQAAHADRTAPTAETRPGVEKGHCVHWSLSDGGSGDLLADFKAHKALTGARERGGASIGLHLLLGVSPQWVAEAGDIHDRRNPRVKDLFEAARDFTEGSIGGVYAVRLDLDELGGGVVDGFCAPTHVRRGRPRKDGTRGSGTPEISVKTALHGLQKKAGGGKSYEALQTLWAGHVHARLDARLVRGTSAKITGRQHLTVSEFREAAERAKAHDRRREGEQALALNTLAFVAEEQDRIKASEHELAQREAELDAVQVAQDRRENELEAAEVAIADRERAFAERQLLLDLEAEVLDERRMDLTIREHTILMIRREQDQREGNFATMSVALEQRQRDVGAAEVEIVEARADVVRRRVALDKREDDARAAEAKAASEREAFARTVESFASQRHIHETDLDVRWSQIAMAAAETDSQRDVEAQKLAGERAKLTAQIEAEAERDARRKIDLDEREELLRAAEMGVAEATARQAKEAAHLEAERRNITAREAELAVSEDATRGREALAQQTVASVETARGELERDRDDLVDGVTCLISSAPAVAEPRTRSGWVTDAIGMVERAIRTAIQSSSERTAAAERSALDREHAASAAAAANAEQERELQALHMEMQRQSAELQVQQDEIDRRDHAFNDRMRRQNAETAALQAGLLAIECGDIDEAEALVGRPDLTPAEPLLRSVLKTIIIRVDQIAASAHSAHAEAKKRIAQAREMLDSARRAREAADAREQSALLRETAAINREERAKATIKAARRLENVIAAWLPRLPAEVRDAVGAFRIARSKDTDRAIGS